MSHVAKTIFGRKTHDDSQERIDQDNQFHKKVKIARYCMIAISLALGIAFFIGISYTQKLLLYIVEYVE